MARESTGRRTIVSAPGKVLLAGGYLVLDRDYSGLVVATSSRFYCVIDTSPSGPDSSLEIPSITVQAGQFPRDESTWSYRLQTGPQGGFALEQVDKRKNKFVEITLTKALEVVLESLIKVHGEEAMSELEKRVRGDAAGMRIVVLADNDFYSQRDTVSCVVLACVTSS
jgi:phosphomevalonate kinase